MIRIKHGSNMLVRTFVHQMKGVTFFHEVVVAPLIFIEKTIQWALILFHAEMSRLSDKGTSIK